ncbi:ATPase [Pedobacter yulinensis]|uniref:ATPase n=1 Tax=Pedobacter yulinensis TaxID=2126353 RepID=A0A2T3HJH8_9SPHI|nr:SRPBCC domain-containing protein [Pedobacter yulinensis]PST82592.1 ATPase [Pedobacter yulinensis]
MEEHKKEVHIEYELDAPRALVFAAWTDPKHLEKWYAPEGCSITIKHMDVREGGRYHMKIDNPQFGPCWTRGSFTELRPPEKLVITMTFADEADRFVDPSAMGMKSGWPKETVLTVTFEDLGERTRLRLHQSVSEALAIQTGAHPSWINMLGRLRNLVESIQGN